MQFPLVHLNGTSRESLLAGYLAAYRAASDAVDAATATAPHGRDYYLHRYGDAISDAMKEHLERLRALIKVRDEYAKLVSHVSEES